MREAGDGHDRRAASRARSQRPTTTRALATVRAEVEALCRKFPLYPEALELSAAVARGVRAGRRRWRARSPGFEPRAGQLEMADAVADVFADGGVLLAEAGTGTGKTLAYLVPAILSRQRVLVSTGTKNLQEQIFFKDLPVLRDALGVPFTATYMKGRGNYLCLHRFDAFEDSAGDPLAATRRVICRCIDEWSRDTETGDRAELEDLPEDLPFWNEIAATTENCLGTECPRYDDCFVTRMRQRAAESDVVIVNHHLLCADARCGRARYGEVIPACSYAIVDEAHQLEDVATQYFGIARQQLPGRRSRARRRPRGGARALADRDRAGAARATTPSALRDHARAFFAALQMLRFEVPGARRQRRQPRPHPAPRTRRDWSTTGAALDRARSTALEADDRARRSDAAARTCSRSARRAARAARRPAGSCCAPTIRTTSTSSRSAAAACSCAPSPIDVSTIVRELLLDRMHGDGADVGDADRRRLVRLRPRPARHRRRATRSGSPSEFDYARRRSSTCRAHAGPAVAATSSTAAGARGHRDPASGRSGRAFVLFTSYANAARRCSAIAATALDYPILVQGTRAALARCCASSRRRRTPCCSRPRASGRAWTSSARR